MSKQSWLMVALTAALVATGLFGLRQCELHQQALDDIKTTQTSNEQTRFEIQQANSKLGLARSQLLTQAELNNKHQAEIDELKKKLKSIGGSGKVRPISRDEAVVVVDSGTKGGTTEATPPGSPTIAYSWTSPDRRFHLIDPDIYAKDNEEFSYKVQIRVRGYILSDKSGKLQARQVTAEEVVTQPDGTMTPTGKQVEIASNEFEYIAPKAEKTPWSILNPRVQFQFDTLANPGIAVEVANLGNYFDWANVGLNAQVSAHVSGGLAGLQESAVGIGLSYSLLRPLLDTNVSVGAAIVTPVNDLAGTWMLTGNIGFYLTN